MNAPFPSVHPAVYCTARAFVLGAALALSLCSCDVLFGGLFPGDLGQERAQRDLSGEIAESDASSFSLAIVKSGPSEFILLFSTSGFDPARTHFLALSPQLSVVNRFDMTALTSVPPASTGFKGDGAVVRHVDGHLIVGNIDMVVAGGTLVPVRRLAPTPTPPPSVDAIMSRWSIAGPTTASFTWTNFRTDGAGSLFYDAYQADWSGVIHLAAPIGAPYELVGVFTDPENEQGNAVLLVFQDSQNNTSYFVTVRKDGDLSAGLAGPPILSNPAYPVFSVRNLDGVNLFMTSDSIVGFDQNTRSWVRFAPADPANVQSLHTGLRDGYLTRFSFSGRYYCVWDPKKRILTTYDTWW